MPEFKKGGPLKLQVELPRQPLMLYIRRQRLEIEITALAASSEIEHRQRLRSYHNFSIIYIYICR
jgi:hypothetical protein